MLISSKIMVRTKPFSSHMPPPGLLESVGDIIARCNLRKMARKNYSREKKKISSEKGGPEAVFLSVWRDVSTTFEQLAAEPYS